MKCYKCKEELTEKDLVEGYDSIYECPECGRHNVF